MLKENDTRRNLTKWGRSLPKILQDEINVIDKEWIESSTLECTKNCLFLHCRTGPVYPNELRSTIVPTISVAECINYYRGRCEVSDKNICTLDRSGRRSCSFGDSGSPLVADRKLIGVHSSAGSDLSRVNPDIYVNLSHPAYKNWIISHLRLYSLMKWNLNNPHNPYSPHNPHNPHNPRNP